MAEQPSAFHALYNIADELDAAIDEQTYDERQKADFDMPDDAELCVNITCKQYRELGKAINAASRELARADELQAENERLRDRVFLLASQLGDAPDEVGSGKKLSALQVAMSGARRSFDASLSKPVRERRLAAEKAGWQALDPRHD